MSTTKPIKLRFNDAAKGYERFGAVQARVAYQLAALAAVHGGTAPATIVEAGCGTGFLTEILCQRFTSARLHALDLAPAMVEYCAQRLAAHHRRLTCHCLDAQDTAAWQQFTPLPIDWVISSLCLQWTDDWRASAALWASCARRLMLSVPVQGSFQEWLRAHEQAGCEPGLYPLPTIDELAEHLQSLGRLRHFDCQTETTHYDNALDFARHFRGLGAHQPRPGHRPVALRCVLKHLPKGITADYRIAYVVLDVQ